MGTANSTNPPTISSTLDTWRNGSDPELMEARAAMVPLSRAVQVSDGGIAKQLTVTRRGVGPIQTPYGNFYQIHFTVEDRWRDYHVIVCCRSLGTDFTPIFKAPGELLLRIDSGCCTGQIYHDGTCECREQLLAAMQRIHEEGEGLVICIPTQDGRGMGVDFKLATLLLQKRRGDDTYDAATAIAGHRQIDVRTYAGAVAILRYWSIPAQGKLRLLTNNPEKMMVLHENGYLNQNHVPLVIPPTPLTERNLIAKRDKLGHLL